MSAARCPLRHCGGLLEWRLGEFGRVFDFCARCDRRRRGICRDCQLPVEGQVGKAVRCATHKREALRAAGRRCLADPETRRRKNAQARERSRRPAAKARKRERRREWCRRNPDRVRQYKRRYLLQQSPTYLETQRRHNADPERQAKKRELALRRYYERHPVRPDPHCAGCGVAIAWTPGKGRPRRTCDECCSPAELRRRQRGYNTKEFRERRRDVA